MTEVECLIPRFPSHSLQATNERMRMLKPFTLLYASNMRFNCNKMVSNTLLLQSCIPFGYVELALSTRYHTLPIPNRDKPNYDKRL